MSYVLPYASRSVTRGGCSIPVRGPLRIEDELIHALDYLYSKGIVINQFHLTATTTGASETVSIARLTTYYDTTIDWGDGTAPETLVANVTTARTHVYATAGTYPITVNHAHLITQLRIDNAKLGGLDTSELQYSVLTYFWVTLATNCKIDSADMVDWRPTDWRLYSMPAGTYSISSANMVDWRPTDWYLISMPTAGSSYTFAASCMRAWTALATLTMNDLGLDATTIDAVLADLYAGRMGYTAAAPTATMGGTNADPTGVYQAMVPPTTGMETKYELINDSAAQGFKKWAITT